MKADEILDLFLFSINSYAGLVDFLIFKILIFASTIKQIRKGKENIMYLDLHISISISIMISLCIDQS